jgi:colicin import membrane protein
MENRSLSVVALLIALGGLCGLVQAASEPDAAQVADWGQRNANAAELKNEARQLKDSADRVFAEKSVACQEKFQVNACLAEAHKEHSAQLTEARRLDNQAKAQEREVRKEQLADRDARNLAEAGQREADLKRRQADITATRAEAQKNEDELRAAKEKEAVLGARRHAADAERVQKKQAAHAAKVTRKKEEAARREAAEVSR